MRADVAALAALYGSPRPVRDVPAVALLGLRAIDGRVFATIEAPGGLSERIEVDDAADPRLAGLRDIDRRRVALALHEVRR
jgi:hypothetical protein